MEAGNNLEALILKILDKSYYLTTACLVETLRSEFPDAYEQVLKFFAAEYGLSKCGIMMSPFTAVAGTLNHLAEKGLVEKKTEANCSLWWQKNTGSSV